MFIWQIPKAFMGYSGKQASGIDLQQQKFLKMIVLWKWQSSPQTLLSKKAKWTTCIILHKDELTHTLTLTFNCGPWQKTFNSAAGINWVYGMINNILGSCCQLFDCTFVQKQTYSHQILSHWLISTNVSAAKCSSMPNETFINCMFVIGIFLYKKRGNYMRNICENWSHSWQNSIRQIHLLTTIFYMIMCNEYQNMITSQKISFSVAISMVVSSISFTVSSTRQGTRPTIFAS